MVRGIFAAAGVAAFVTMASAASAELAEWKQDRVTKYAKELAAATADLKQALDDIGIQNFAQQNALYKVKDTVDMLDTAANGLEHALESGKGREETMPRYKRIDVLRRDAEQEGQRADIPESVFERVFSVGSALLKLRPYYEDAPVNAGPEAK